MYHFHVTQIKRSTGQSAVAAAAYRAGEKLHSEYYGEDSDYTRKGSVICSDILLPSHAPPEYADRETLWNAVEKAERGKKAQLAYSFDIERYQKLKLRLYEDLSDGIIDKSEYFEFRNSYTKIIEEKQEALLRVKKEMKQSVTTGATERNWVTLFKQYENIEELNRRVLMALVDRILIYEDHAIEIVFKYKDEYQQTLEYVLGYADELAIAG